jgi:hypothetical protein
MAAGFEPVYVALREVMLASSPGMQVARDDASGLLLTAPWPHPRKPAEPMGFGWIRTGKAYVSYHLMPLYMSAAMQARVTPALKKRMQGKTCFNFKALDEAAFADLAALTRAGAEAFSKPLRL